VIAIPKEKPVIENLNSYYLDINKLLEHYQGEIGSGGVHFSSPSTEGAIFFDKDELLNGFFQDSEGKSEGKEAINRLTETAENNNYIISIYEIDADKVYFWANISAAEKIYKDLSAEFTDLEGLIRKMVSEKLTGHIDVSIGDGKESGLVFFDNGNVIGGSYSWDKGELSRSKEDWERLIRKTRESGGVFDVSRIPLTRQKMESELKEGDRESPSTVLMMLEELLGVFERIIESGKDVQSGFTTILKKKFIEKADQFVFLDPFAAEFEYADHKIAFKGDATSDEVVQGLMACLKEIAHEYGIIDQVEDELGPWSKKYKKEVERYRVNL
jgi:hypothetical protein